MSEETINKLLKKYFEGDTNLEEENALKTYFLSDKIDAQLEKFKPIFIYLNAEKNIKISEEFATKIDAISEKKQPEMQVVKRSFYWLKMAAAVAFLMLSVFVVVNKFKTKIRPQIAVNQPIKPKAKGAKTIILDETTDPELAFAEVEKALMMVSKNMKKGTDETTESLQKVKAATKVINQ
jgi:hypothetical protein